MAVELYINEIILIAGFLWSISSPVFLTANR